MEIQNADDFLKRNCHKINTDNLIEFAKMHRKAILEEIAEDYLYYLEGSEGSERLNQKKFFKEVYSINKIK